MMDAAQAHSSALRRAPGAHAAAVDPALLLVCALAGPARVDARAAWFATPGAPLVLPIEVLSDRAARVLAAPELPLGRRVAAALAWGAEREALRAAAGHAGPLSADPELDAALRRWAEAVAQRLGLPAVAVAAIGADGRPRLATADERAALADVQELLAPLAWPRWRGPLVLVPYGVEHPVLDPGAVRAVRPALPALRLPDGGRAGLATAIAELVLALSAPPPDGWPGWLTAGVAGCARARAEGQGLADRALAERRAAAGEAAVAALLAGGDPEPGLATAVVGGLLHPSRRRHLPVLLDLLRHGAQGPGAVATAYGLSPSQLAAPPGGRSPAD